MPPAALPGSPAELPGSPADLAGSLARCLAAGSGRLPLPGSGQTLRRWQALAEVAASDLALAKLFEGHTDALAIMASSVPPTPILPPPGPSGRPSRRRRALSSGGPPAAFA